MKNQPKSNPLTLEEIDSLFQNETTPLSAPFDALVDFQLAEGKPLEDGPIEKAQELMDSWDKEVGGNSRNDWEAAAKRAQGAKPVAVKASKQPYASEAAKAAQEDTRRRVPLECAETALAVLTDTGADFLNHNLLTLANGLAYADIGLHVIDGHALDATGKGTGPGGQAKVPRGSGWQNRASTSRNEIIAAWTGDGTYPADNRGSKYPYAKPSAPRNVCLTFPEDCDLFVLDIDGVDGRQALEALQVEYGPLPNTWKSITGSGGLHLIFRAAGVDIRNTASAIATGVDIRGANGQIVAPPSIHPSGNFYRWEDDCAPWECDVADAPEWLRKLSFEATKGRGEDAKESKRKTKSRGSQKTTGKDSGEWEKHLSGIGDGEGLKGFDAPINETACAYFAANGVDADEIPLKDVLVETILAAPCKDNRAEDRYATDDYLDARIEGARDYVADTAESEPVSLNTDSLSARVKSAGFSKDSSEAAIRDFMTDLLKEDADIPTQARATVELVTATGLGKRQLNSIWQIAREVLRVENRTNGKIPIVGEWDDGDMVKYAETRLTKAKSKDGDPVMYCYEGDVCGIKNNSREMLTYRQFKARLDDTTKWTNDKRGVLSPDAVAQHCFYRDGKPYPNLAGIKTSPYFDAHGNLIAERGYNSAAQTFLALGGLEVPRVSAQPSNDEVREALRPFVEEVFGDFPIGGLGREQLIENVHSGASVPDFANLMAMVLQPFLRDMIDGPTPLYILTKPKAGTGATLIVDLVATISTGDVAPPQPLPTNTDELDKTMLSIAIDGDEFCFFDNLNVTVSGGALASNVTARKVKGRLLSTSRMVEAPVRNLWVATGNNLEASSEILRRVVMIELDAHMAHPETRSGWHHADVMGWVKDHRGQLVWAALTLIQNWIAKGRPTEGVPVLNSFENWSPVVGGVLMAAGVNGFLANQARKDSYATAVSDNNVQTLMNHLASQYDDGEIFRAGGTSKVRNYEGQCVVSIKDVLNVCGEDGASGGKAGALLIDGWGYSKDADGYVGSNRISREFRKAARAPWEVEGGEITFEEHPDPKNTSQVFWIMRKREV